MRRPRHISPTSYMLYKKNPQEFYHRYLADNKKPRFPSSDAMSVGTAYDCKVKSVLSVEFFGKDNFEGEAERTINPEYLDMALAAGDHIFDAYVESGAMGDLLKLVSASPIQPIMEEVVTCKVGDVIIYGKPDLAICTPNMIPIMLDFKVNGYCSKYPKSPAKGWMVLRHRPKDVWEVKHCHPKTKPVIVDGVKVNRTFTLDEVYKDWAVQLTLYGWALESMGVTSNADPICQIEQIVSKPSKIEGEKPILRFATHSCFISPEFKADLYDDLQNLWELCHSDWFFRDLSKEQSQFQQKVLDDASVQPKHEMMDVTENTFANAFAPIGSEGN